MSEAMKIEAILLKEKEVAEMLRLSTYTVASMRKEGRGPPFIMMGTRVRYMKELVERWLKEQSHGHS